MQLDENSSILINSNIYSLYVVGARLLFPVTGKFFSLLTCAMHIIAGKIPGSNLAVFSCFFLWVFFFLDWLYKLHVIEKGCLRASVFQPTLLLISCTSCQGRDQLTAKGHLAVLCRRRALCACQDGRLLFWPLLPGEEEVEGAAL